uniref:Structural polyprotein n=1 Tax=Anthurium amnicola TaxID=1678845 RepID=A0A1D1Y8H2_9ARAE
MLLRKRPRPAMKRTTSLSEFSFDLNAGENPQQPRHQRQATGMEGVPVMRGNGDSSGARRQPQPEQPHRVSHQKQGECREQHRGPSEGLDTGYLPSTTLPRIPRRVSDEFAVVPAHFLRSCGLCKRHLGPGKDTFMYRGEVAFCSLECRQQRMNQDERKDKCSLASMKRDPPQPATNPETSSDGKTVAAA